jgi:hypothetical protein
MGRRIVTTQFQDTSAEGKPDAYFDRLLKYIPSDVVGCWLAATGIINSLPDKETQNTWLWIIFIFGLVITPIWVRNQTKEKGKPIAYTEIFVSTIAFVVWIFALGGPFTSFGFYQPYQGSVILILYTTLVAAIVPPEG